MSLKEKFADKKEQKKKYDIIPKGTSFSLYSWCGDLQGCRYY
jgi:hypothetical protein